MPSNPISHVIGFILTSQDHAGGEDHGDCRECSEHIGDFVDNRFHRFDPVFALQIEPILYKLPNH